MELKDILTHPRSDKANMVGLKILNERPQYTGSYWMNEKGNGLVLKSILDHINNIWSTQAKVILEDAKQVHIIAMHNGEEVDIHFPKAFPQDSPMLYKQGGALQLDTEWQYNGDILQAFKTIINKYTINL